MLSASRITRIGRIVPPSSVSLPSLLRSGMAGARPLATSGAEKKLFDKIIIANRGEIACRVIRTAKRLGIKTVACYSDADANALHVELADEAVHIGPSAAAESYLRGEKIIEAAKRTGAQAVHPGYGFLSENLDFCKMCEDAGIVFIGPPPNAIRAMGSKSESKDIMINAKVPVTPGYHGANQDKDFLFGEAKRIGYPVMIKAVSGGGGKGMRAVFSPDQFYEALDGCKREALKSFKDENVLIEKLVQAPRHVELQIFGDQFGNVVHLRERDCSVQRRHQKVLEEAPAPNLTDDVRRRMGDAAVACAKAVGYVGAGTVEFLVDSVTQDFYFCEMNTRLQVEHPVTEMITGLDLVEWQLRVASGNPLPLTQAEVLSRVRGCAIEARIYAENPARDFLPSTGRLAHLRPVDPKATESGVRVDFGIRSGDTVSTFYDPMIAKLIAFDETRDKAVAKLGRALREFQVAGVANNIDFLVDTSKHPGFATQQATTAFFSEHLNPILAHLASKASLRHNGQLTDHSVMALTAIAQHAKLIGGSSSGASNAHSEPWAASWADWRPFGSVKRPLKITTAYTAPASSKEEAHDDIVHLESSGQNAMSIHSSHMKNYHDVAPVNVTIRTAQNVRQTVIKGQTESLWNLSLEINGKLCSGTAIVYINATGATVADVWLEGQTGDASTHGQLIVPAVSHTAEQSSSSRPIVVSPMPGRIVKLISGENKSVKAGTTLIVLEAMKMEHIVTAPSDGTVTFFVEEGATVSEGEKLAEVAK